MEEYWNEFEQTGRIEDYLKYKGIENIEKVEVGGLNEATESEGHSN